MTAYVRKLDSHGPGNVTCLWPPGQKDCLQASGPDYTQRPAFPHQQPLASMQCRAHPSAYRSHGIKTWCHP